MPAGRPLKFDSPDQMQKAIDAYFEATPEDEVTITGLALALGTYRSTLIDYEKRDEYSNTIKTAKQRVEHSYERALRKNGRAGEIFGLKNFGWTDKRQTEHSGEVSVKAVEHKIIE